MTAQSGYRERNSTADRALTILGLFSDTRPTISAAEITEALGVARSTAYRYAQSLIGAGFLDEIPGQGFQLGARVFELARIARRGNSVWELALPTMRSLAEQFHHTVLLTRLVGDMIVCLERQEWSGQSIRVSYERGAVLDLNAGASALVLLGGLSDERVASLLATRELHRFTPATLTAPAEILERLQQLRDTGYIVSRGELDPDALGIAVPITIGHSTAAGLSIVALQSQVDERELALLIEELRARALAISTRLALSQG